MAISIAHASKITQESPPVIATQLCLALADLSLQMVGWQVKLLLREKQLAVSYVLLIYKLSLLVMLLFLFPGRYPRSCKQVFS